MQITLK